MPSVEPCLDLPCLAAPDPVWSWGRHPRQLGPVGGAGPIWLTEPAPAVGPKYLCSLTTQPRDSGSSRSPYHLQSLDYQGWRVTSLFYRWGQGGMAWYSGQGSCPSPQAPLGLWGAEFESWRRAGERPALSWLCDVVISRNSISTQHRVEGVSLSSPPRGAGEGSWGEGWVILEALDGCE